MLSVTRRARSAAAACCRRVRSAAALFACTVAAVVCAGAPPAQADTPPLQHYDITADYVSGLSSGAAEAVQFQVAYSATFKGLAFFGGAPYDCAQDRPTIPGLRTVIRAQVTTMIADPTGAPLLAAQAAAEELKNPRHDPGAIGRHPYPHTASRWRTALPAEPVRRRPAGRAGDPDRPAMYPGGTWHPPPVDLRRTAQAMAGARPSCTADLAFMTRPHCARYRPRSRRRPAGRGRGRRRRRAAACASPADEP